MHGMEPHAKQNADVLSFYKKIIRIRKKNPCLRTGNIVPLVCEKDDIRVFMPVRQPTNLCTH